MTMENLHSLSEALRKLRPMIRLETAELKKGYSLSSPHELNARLGTDSFHRPSIGLPRVDINEGVDVDAFLFTFHEVNGIDLY